METETAIPTKSQSQEIEKLDTIENDAQESEIIDKAKEQSAESIEPESVTIPDTSANHSSEPQLSIGNEIAKLEICAQDNNTDDVSASSEEPTGSLVQIQAKTILDDVLVQSLSQAELEQKKCELCLEVFSINEIVSMLKCAHICCAECAKEYFTRQITNRSITNCVCPCCKEPNLNGSNVTEEGRLEYFYNLEILLKNVVDEEVHSAFQRKVRDRTLINDPNFRRCTGCAGGFITSPKDCKITCPDCGSTTCASCLKPWESQHSGLSCEKYAEWKEANDPKSQAEGIERYLQTYGISCPNCKYRYSLDRGGCLHFTCTQCKFNFCYGCNKPFIANCSVSSYCANQGRLHAHHPRNCLFYLRDKEPEELQQLLRNNNIPFDTEPSEALKQMNGYNPIVNCPIQIPNELMCDVTCSAEVPHNSGGMCRTHYIEYLVGKIWKAQIDPVPIMDLKDCMQELRRRGISLPDRGAYDTDPMYREMCQKAIKQWIPLK
ncbi:AGAP007788-PA-like protein [Anopheles sinensis]|uniref:AGAP007788-PA-like protein n=1 Tax=Anopheles sinensis TaxID=74873 RepID=A0A084VI47_ANOSI|nr:AGAP007788-PA-like protein [Anopheles sinensis]